MKIQKIKNTHAHPRGFHDYRPNKIDREKVKKLILLGSTEAQIAAILGDKPGIDVVTLRRHYGDLLREYREIMLSRCANRAFTKAVAGDTKMIQFVLQMRHPSWREKTKITLGGEVLVKRVIGVSEDEV